MSRPVTIKVSHELGAAAAKARIENGFSQFGQKLGLGASINRTWDDNQLAFDANVMMQNIRGTIEVHERDVVVTVHLPALLASMAEAIKGKVEKESTLLLEKK